MIQAVIHSILWLRHFLSSFDWYRFALCFLVLGVLLRLWGYVGGGSLEMDELTIVLNLQNRSYAELLQSLDYKQMAPIGWLFVHKWLIGVWGNVDYSMRLLAFLFGVGSIFIMYVTTKRVLMASGMFLAVALISIVPRAIDYSFFVKPYSGDMFFSILILFLTFDLLRTKNISAGKLVPLFITGIIGMFLSFPIVILLASSGGALMLRSYLSRNNRLLISGVVIGVVWLAVFAVIYISFHSQPSGVASWMREEGWGYSFAPVPFTSLSSLLWYPKAILNNLAYQFALEGAVLAGGLYLVGIFHLLKSSKFEELALITLPLILALVLSMFQLYPFEDRLTLYLLPVFILGAGFGFDYLVKEFGYASFASVFLASVLVISIGWRTYALFNQPGPPLTSSNIHPAMSELSEKAMPDDSLYVYYGALPAYWVYRDRYEDVRGLEVFYGRAPGDNEACFVKDLQQLQNKGRVWILFSHILNWEDSILLFAAQRFGKVQEDNFYPRPPFMFRGTRLVLLDFQEEHADMEITLRPTQEPKAEECLAPWMTPIPD